MNQNLPRKSNGRLAFLLLSLLLSLFTAAGAQTCPTGSLTLSSQAQIDAFPTDYPGIVEYEAAELVASSFFRKRGFYNIGVKPILAYQATLTRSNVQDGVPEDTPLFYAFNNGNKGYVIIAASYYAEPILAYSKERAFDYENAAPGAKYWLKKYEKQIAWIVQNKNGEARKEMNAKWDQWISNDPSDGDPVAEMNCNDESYLLRTTWHQVQYYNSMCPADPEGPNDGHALVGCVALAMGQVMKYWNYPASGTGFVNYQHVDYGMISADFGATNYQWWNMPNSLNDYNNSISTLLSHCGISVYMDYGPDVSGAYTLISGSSPGSAQVAYSTYFNFHSPTPYERAGHTDSEWSNLIITEMNAGRPVQYEALDNFAWPWQSDAAGRHSFVIDGYNSDDNTFHINWGWAGSSDGWYLINDLTPEGETPEGDDYNYNFDDDEKMLTNIRPNFTIPDGNDDDFQNATYIGGTSINLSGELTPGDSDWYSFDYNGSTYYFELIGEGFYAVDFSITGNVVNIETLPLHGKATTEVILYDTDGITEFGRDAGSGQYCSFSILSYSFPQQTPVSCTSLITPSTTSNVDVNTVFQWSQVQEATSYQLTIGTTPGSGDLYNEILSQNSFSPPNELPYGATLYINVRPFNSQNSATGCQEIILTTEPVPIPDITCTNLITPLNNASDVSINTSLSWADVPGATGYYISVIGSQTGFILDNLNLVYGNSYYELPEPLPYGEVISVTITPYNQNEVAVNCPTETFTTEAAPPTCSDGIQNGDETGVDCGGVLCSPCPPGELDLQLADACVTYTTPVCGGDVLIATATFLNPNAEDWRGRVLFRWEDVNDPSNYIEILLGNQNNIIPAGQTAQINATFNTSVLGPGDYVLTISESYYDGSNQPWELVIDGPSCINYFGLTVQDCNGTQCTAPAITAINTNCDAVGNFSISVSFTGGTGELYDLYTQVGNTQLYEALDVSPEDNVFLGNNYLESDEVFVYVEHADFPSECATSMQVPTPSPSCAIDEYMTVTPSGNCYEPDEVITAEWNVPQRLYTLHFCEVGGICAQIYPTYYTGSNSFELTVPDVSGDFYFELRDFDGNVYLQSEVFEISNACVPVAPDNIQLELASCITYPTPFCIEETQSVTVSLKNPSDYTWTGTLGALLFEADNSQYIEQLTNITILPGETSTFTFTGLITVQPSTNLSLIIAEQDSGLTSGELVLNGACNNDISVQATDCTPACSTVVTNTNESGPGSLRKAVNCANTNPGPDIVTFDIPGAGPHIIPVVSDEIRVTDAYTVIDATTQPGYIPGSIILDGTNGFHTGLSLEANYCQVYGLYIRNFAFTAISVYDVSFCKLGSLAKPNYFTNSFNGVFLGRGALSRDNEFRGNFMGVSPQGADEGNNHGMTIFSSSNNLFEENTFAYNSKSGVFYNGGLNGGNKFFRNSFYCNASGFSGPNGQNTNPVVTTASPDQISGTANAGDIIEVFRQGSLGCLQGCQGKDHLGTAIADNNGNWFISSPFLVAMSGGEVVTAMATESVLGTSRFSNCLALSASCPAPGGLSASSVTSSSAVLDWNDVPEADSYSLEWWETGQVHTTEPVAQSTFSLSGLSPETEYCFMVQSICGGNSGSFSGQFCFTTEQDDSCNTVVTNTNDSGAGSLREAINCANSHPGADVITFDIPGSGPFTIQVASGLPTLTDDNTTIDATTQLNYSPGLIELRSPSQNNSNGFTINADNCHIYGLKITSFGTGVRMTQYSGTPRTVYVGAPGKGNIFYKNAQGIGLYGSLPRAIIKSNELYGDFALNFTGIHLQSNDNIIGGADLAEGNTIHNLWRGVAYASSANSNIAIQKNSFYCNTSPIYIFESNTATGAPQVTTATSSEISGTAAAGAAVEVFYADNTCSGTPCQGREFIAVTTADGSGNWSIQGNYNLGSEVTALAKNGNLHTSRFADCTVISSSLPECTQLLSPLNGTTNVSVGANLSWAAAEGATGYHLTLGTSSGGNDILDNIDIGNLTTYDPGTLPINSNIYLTIVPFNSNGDAIGCMEEQFTTELIPIPGCTDPTSHNYDPAANQNDGSCETCSDGIQNGDETGVDCGGTLCNPCDCVHPDYAALETIYNSLGGDNWTVSNHGWLSDCDPCSWYGVTCDQGRVTCIDLDGNVSCDNSDFGSGIGASGDISNIAGISLPFLESFHLSNNSVSGNIPDFQHIPNLIHLGLSNNQLSGPIPNFSNLVNLTHLFIESNFLTGNIPEFNGMASLTNFHASDNLLEGSLPAFEYSPNIWTVYVDNNNLSGEIPVIENMNYFIIESNDFSGCFPDYVCDLVQFSAINNAQLPWGGDSYNFCVLGIDQTGEGSCPEPQIPGCTDPTAHNYNPAANQDDGSCETCSDGIQNGDETAIDCGGMLCGPCPIDPPSITAFTEGEILDNGCSDEGRPDEGITIPLAWTAVAGADLYNVVLAVAGAPVPLLNSNTVTTSSVFECTACFTNAASVGVKVRARVNGTWTAFSPTVTGYFEPVNTDCPDCVPAAGCNNITAELGPDGNLFLTPGMIDDGTSEACGTGTLSLDGEYFTCDDLGLQAVTLTATDGNGGSASCTAQVTIVPGTDLPAGWSATDIGDPGSGSDYAYNPCIGPKGAFDISAGGYNLFPGNADEVAYVHRPLCGNGGIQVDVEAITNGYAGIMIRESSAPGSKMTAIYSNLSSLLRRETRYETDGSKSISSALTPFATRLRLVRQGNWIRGFYRTPNSSSWQLFHQVYLPMSQCVEMGLAVFTTDPNGQASATFGRVNWLSSGNGNFSVPDLDMATAEPLAAPRLFPNPSGGQFTLSFDQVLPAPATVVLRNPVGQVLEQRNLQMGTVQTEWNLGHHPDGLYLLEVRQEGQAPFLLRLIKTK